MNNNLQLVLKSSTTEMSLNDHDAGIYIVPELDGLTGLPEIRTTSGVNAGYDGGWTSAQKFDARSIVIRGVIANEDKTEVERMRRELVALLAQGKNEQLELDFVTETGRAYEVQVRTIACDMAMQRVLTQQEFMITLRADDPLIYDNSSAGEEATVNVSGATGGFRIPFEIPLAIDAGSEETVVQNSGLESVAPTIKMYGALHNPKIINHTTNQAMQIEAELGFTEGAWTTPVDAPEGTNVSFEPEREAPIESAKLKGDTYQQTYSGKNLVDSSLDKVSQQFNVTATASGNGIKVVGSSSGSGHYATLQIQKATSILGQSVAITFKYTGNATGALVYLTNSSGAASTYVGSITLSGGNASGVVTMPASLGTDTGVGIVLYVTASGEAVFTDIQAELGSTATAYEPYVGGVPAPNPDYPQAVQTVTGEQTIAIRGKNLLKLPSADTNAGVTYSINSDGTFNIHGTNNSGYEILFSLYLDSDEFQSVDYTLGAREALPYGLGCRCEIYRGGTWKRSFVSVNYTRQTQTGTPDFTDANRVRVAISVANGATVNIDNVGIQLEKGSSPTTFVPYQGQSYEINLGKNLAEISNFSVSGTGYSVGASSGLVSVSSTTTNRAISLSSGTDGGSWLPAYDASSVADHHITSVGGTYILSLANVTKTISGSQALYVAIYTNKRAVSNTSLTSSSDFTPTAITLDYDEYIKDIWIWLGGNTTYTATFNVQLEKGSQATSYAAYFAPIELCKIGSYQDYIWKDGDTWKIHKACDKYVFDNSALNWGVGTGTGGWVLGYTVDSPFYGKLAVGDASSYQSFCSHFTFQRNSTTWTGNGKCGYDTGGAFWCIYSAKTTKQDFLDWLGEVNPAVYYPLSASAQTDTIITNETLIAQLEALVDGNAVVYEGKTNVIVAAAEGDLPGIAAIRYYTDKEPDQRDELIVDSRLKTITLNGLDVYHLKTEGSEFPMLAPGENKLSLQSDITGDNGYAKVSYKQGYLSI